MTNPKAGHTSAAGMSTSAEGLRDGDGLSSPSLTNPYEGLHGNGIIRVLDGTLGDSNRNSISATTPGYIQTASSGVVTITGGWCVLDGALYKFAGGVGGTQPITIGATGTTNFNGELPAVPTTTSEVYVVVYICSDSGTTTRVRYEVGTPVIASTGTPLIPAGFLVDPAIGNTRKNHQSIVLGVLRYSMTGGAANVTASQNATPVLHDRRVFIRTSPMYMQHITKGTRTMGTGGTDLGHANNSINSHADLTAMYGSPESSDFTNSEFGAIWQSHTPDSHSMLFYAASKTLNGTKAMHTHRLGPDEVKVATIATSQGCTFDGPNIWIATTSGTTTFTPSGVAADWPPGHIIEIYHAAGSHALNFVNAPAGSSTLLNVAITKNAKFIFDGANWHILNHNTVG